MSYTVYSILEDGKTVYVGMTNNMQRRKREQRYKRKLDGRHTFHTFAYGIDKEAAVFLEENLIKKYNTVENGWNVASGYGGKGLPTIENEGRFSKGNNLWTKREWKKVLCVETGDVFNTVKDCAENMGITETGVYKVCNGYRKTYKKLHFEYIE